MKPAPVAFESFYAEPSRNGVYKPAQFRGHGVRMVNMGELFGHELIGTQDMERIELSAAELDRSELRDGDLLFGRRSLVEAGAGKCSLVVDPTEALTFESSIIRVRLKRDKANPRFFHYYFAAPQGRGLVRTIVSGAAVKGIRGSDLAKLHVTVPLLPVQDAIADVLKAYDDLIENNRRRMALLEEAARQLYREWFVRLRFPGHEHTRITNGVPEEWERAQLGELAEITMGQSPESKHYNEDGEGPPFHQGVTDFGARFVTHRIYSTALNRVAEAGDILCSVRAPVGRLNVTLDRIVIGRGLSALRSKTGHQSLLLQQLRAHFFKEDLIGGGAIFASVTKKEFSAQEVLEPPERLKRAFEEVTVPCDEQIRVLHLQNQQLRAARDLLLPRLMSGEIAV